jgi:hypothetical protein
MDVALPHFIRALGLSPADEQRLRELIEQYGRQCHSDGYEAGRAVALGRDV